MSELDLNQITELLKLPESTPTKGTKPGKSITDYERAEVETYPCNVCGYCEWPEKCVSSVVCPACGATQSNLCVRPSGGFTGYHEERWQLVKSLHGVYYK